MSEVKKFRISLPEDLDAKYVNIAFISHTPQEFILDFASVLPQIENQKINTRLIFSPIGLKMFAQALLENLQRYENVFGEIKIPRGQTLADQLFKTTEQKDPPKED